MADLSATCPDGQLEALDIYLGNASETVEDRIAGINTWLQVLVNTEVWNMARQNAADAVADPTA